MSTKNISKAKLINQVANFIGTINPVELVTATNVSSVKSTWINNAINGDYGNPQLEYNRELLEKTVSYAEPLRRLRKIIANEPSSLINDLVIGRLDEALRSTELAAAILIHNDAEAKRHATAIYGMPTSEQVYQAYRLVREEADDPLPPTVHHRAKINKTEREALEAKKFYANDIKYWFERVLDLYNIEGWRVEINPIYTAIDVRDKNSSGMPVVGIPFDSEKNGLQLICLVGHEIECHLRGSENCRQLLLELLGEDSPYLPLIPALAKSDNEYLYEGVAKVSDVRLGGDSQMPKPFATIACDLAERGYGFDTITSTLYNFIHNANPNRKKEDVLKTTWGTTYRILRGSSNTARGDYLFSKDYSYFCGFSEAEELSSIYHDFSSMKIEEIAKIAKTMNLVPRYKKLDAALWLKAQLLDQ